MQVTHRFVIKKGTTSRRLQIHIGDSSVTTGAGLTGLAFNTASLTAYYFRDGATSAVQISLVTATLGTWVSGGFVVVDGTNLPGVYELSIPDAALATGSTRCLVVLKGATNMRPCVIEIDIVEFDLVSGSLPLTTLTVSGVTTLTGAVTMAAGLSITQSASNTSALVITGNGTGHGAVITSGSGATGNGVQIVAASTNGNGINASGVGTGSAIVCTGGATGHGVSLVGGATSGNGLRAVGTAGNSQAIYAAGQGSAAGLYAIGGATGNGFEAIGGATSGDGARFVATTSGDGFECVAAGASTYAIRAIASLMSNVVETGYTDLQILALLAAKNLGKRSGMATATNTYRDVNDTANRIVETTDADGNCSGTVLTAP